MKATLSASGHDPGQVPSRALARVQGFVIASHPLPTLAVICFATVLTAAFGGRGGLLVLVAAATCCGQLCVGWTNDVVDADRDRLAERVDKPITTGRVARRAVLVAAVLAGLACIPLSLLIGLLPGTLHLLAVTIALAYDLRLKSTPFSPLTYVGSFALLPVVASQAAGSGWPAIGSVVAAGLLGAAAHAANTVGDAQADAATGVRGLPQLLGPRWSLTATAVLVAVAALVLLPGMLANGWNTRTRLGAGLLTAGALMAVASMVGRAGQDGGRSAFRVTLAAIAFVVLGFVVSVTHAG